MNLIVNGDEGLAPLVGNLEGKLLVIAHQRLNRRYQCPRFQIFKAIGGFGCQEGSLGSAVFGIHVADNEDNRWERHDFIGIASDELAQRAMLDNTPVININLEERIYFLVAKDGSMETGETVDQAMRRLKRITNSAVAQAFHAHPESTVTPFGLMSYPQGAPPVTVKIKKRGGFWIDAN